MASCLVIQHLEPERAYAVGDALAQAGVTGDVRAVPTGALLPPDLADVAGLVVMGGPMSAVSDDGFPSRRAELGLLTNGLRRGLPILGVCLGAQLLALAGGGTVYPGAAGPEIGWAPVELVADTGDDSLLAGLPSELTVLHWHGDTFDPPGDATLLASSACYRHQAFRLGARAWGLQFHLEVDRPAVVPPFPVDSFPYIFLAHVLAGSGWLFAVSRRNRQIFAEIEMDLEGSMLSSDKRTAEVELLAAEGGAIEPVPVPIAVPAGADVAVGATAG